MATPIACIMKSGESVARVLQFCSQQPSSFQTISSNHNFRSTLCTEHDSLLHQCSMMVLGLLTSSFDGWLFTVYKIETETYPSRHSTRCRCQSFLWHLSQKRYDGKLSLAFVSKEIWWQAGSGLWNNRRICWAFCLKTRDYHTNNVWHHWRFCEVCWPQASL